MGLLKMENNIIGLWPNTPPINKKICQNNKIDIEKIFPSGRQALSFAMNKTGISRGDRIAFPEWSSNCVINAISKQATPIPMNEVIRNKIKVRSVLLYEQWGWPILNSELMNTIEYFKNSDIIIDMVDSAHFFKEKTPKLLSDQNVITLTSLSKLIGLPGGGIVKLNNKYLHFDSIKSHQTLSSLLRNNQDFIQNNYDLFLDFSKTYIKTLDSNLIFWLMNNNLLKVIEIERRERNKNTTLILNSSLSDSWPSWMTSAIKQGSGPGIAPLLRNVPDKFKIKAQKKIFDEFNVKTEIYHFNWSGSYLRDNYSSCLAFPVHSKVENLAEILNLLEKL